MAVDALGLFAACAPAIGIPSSIPKLVWAALMDPNWLDAMKAEYDALVSNNTCNLVRASSKANIVSDKWTFCAHLSLGHYKAH
jgi:hypothetical protein